MNRLSHDALLGRLERLTAVGVSLSAEKNLPRLLENILLAAKDITRADGGTLYRVRDRQLHFEILRTDTLNLAMGGVSGAPIPFAPLPLYDEQGAPNESLVAAYAVLRDVTVNIADAYSAQGFDFSGTRRFDRQTGYRSQSFLTIPMKDHENAVIGVLQLINARHPLSGEIIAFAEEDQRFAEALTSQAAIALTNRGLINQLETLFESFIKLINVAIDEKSPYTGGHCERVPVLTMMLAEAAERCETGPLESFHLTAAERYELEIAGLLHDCGKIVTPVHVVDKATKLDGLTDRIHEIDTRFAVLRRDAEIQQLRRRCTALENGEPPPDDAEYRACLRQLDDDRALLRRSNNGGETLSAARQRRIRAIARRRWVNSDGVDRPLLTAEETALLCIPKGTLSPAERDIINDHVVATIHMLEALPWPKHLRRVPEYAGGHHERMDGKGYPRGLSGAQLAAPTRILAIADIFEALTAKDRPYKDGKPLSDALAILGRLKQERHIDADLFDVFIRDRVYLRYAERFLDADQIDAVDPAAIPGYAPARAAAKK